MACQAKAHLGHWGRLHPHKGPRNPTCQAWALRTMRSHCVGPDPAVVCPELARQEADPFQLRVGAPAFLPPPTLNGAAAVPATELGPSHVVRYTGHEPCPQVAVMLFTGISCRKHVSLTTHPRYITI